MCRTCGYHFVVGALERIAQLADPGTFEEAASGLRSADPLAFVDMIPYPERLAAAAAATGLDDAMVVGRAEIDGHRCALATMEFEFVGGSMGSVVGEKFARAVDLALEDSMPLISVASSGGARMQENVLALMQMAKTTCAVDALNEAGIPFISVLSHPTTGGVMASFAALGDVIIAEPGAFMAFAGPAGRAADDARAAPRRLRPRRVELPLRPRRHDRPASRAARHARADAPAVRRRRVRVPGRGTAGADHAESCSARLVRGVRWRPHGSSSTNGASS